MRSSSGKAVFNCFAEFIFRILLQIFFAPLFNKSIQTGIYIIWKKTVDFIMVIYKPSRFPGSASAPGNRYAKKLSV